MKNKDNKNIEQAWEALGSLEDKVVLLTDVIEKELINESSTMQRAPKSKIKPVEMPGDIEVDVKDKYNTEPMNSLTHHYAKNHRIFRKDALHDVMHSKLFWIMLVIIPILFSLIEYILLGWMMTINAVPEYWLQKVIGELVNWFMLVPMLLSSLIIFPTFLAVMRENNQLKRYAMKGMSRKQIYCSYIRFTVGFLIAFSLIWLLVWMPIMNFTVDRIWLTSDQIDNGVHLFNNPWGIFFGMDYYESGGKGSFDYYEMNWYYNMLVTWELEDGRIDTFINAYTEGTINLSDWVIIVNMKIASTMTYEDLQNLYKEMGIDFQYLNIKDTSQLISGHANWGWFNFSNRIFYSREVHFSGVDVAAYFTLLMLVMVGINSVGFKKAMKVNSSRTLIGWGIGLWLFTSVVQSTSILMFKEVYTFNGIDSGWNYVVMILLFILKWMFIFSPVTIMIVGLSLVSGYITVPEVYVPHHIIISFLNVYEQSEILQGYYPTYFLSLVLYPYMDVIYDPLINPIIVKYSIVTLSGLWAIIWIFKTWLFKSRIISFEASR